MIDSVNFRRLPRLFSEPDLETLSNQMTEQPYTRVQFANSADEQLERDPACRAMESTTENASEELLLDWSDMSVKTETARHRSMHIHMSKNREQAHAL